ncbi:hypothetical protein [Stenotrophomonas sp. NPDC078853]|uniref:hypothetical protein n=1 Tax=Stenotrophomonas sp. NPDC078853 TaxID=3364534 RepID=UPI00384E995B
MAVLPYPHWLPEALREGYGIKHASPLKRSTFVSGRALSRRNYTSTPSEVAVRWLLPDADAALFEKWFQEDLVDGAAWFLCRLRTPLGMDYHKSRFVDIYEGPTLSESNLWLISATLELFERPLLADGSTVYPDAVLNSGIIDLTANREWPK